MGQGNASGPPLSERGTRACGRLLYPTGSGHTVVAGELRTFSFTAQQSPGGAARGTAQINNRMVNDMFQVDIDCLKVVGNIAIMSGTITKHTDVTAVGLTGIFGVIDAGEGAGVTDSVTQVFFLPPETLTCQDIEPDEVGPSQLPSWAATSRSTSGP